MALLDALDPAYTTSSVGKVAGANATPAATEDRFLKLLVAQMQNQDPLNPLDNAQVTTQMAQIQTVNGIASLERTVVGLQTQFSALQALQGAGLVGHDVGVPGNLLRLQDGVGRGGFELTGAADSVQVEILAPSGAVMDTVTLGAQASGRHFFEWEAPANLPEQAQLRFRVKALSGTRVETATPLMRDRVTAVTTEDNKLKLELQRSGTVEWSDVQSIH
jgi:flagellar basal-body rod modification protein FlgD